MTTKKKPKRSADDYTGPIAVFFYADRSTRRIEYPTNPIGLFKIVEGHKYPQRPTSLTFLPPEEGWEEARLAEDRPVNKAYLGKWFDLCHEALQKGKK